MNAPLLLAGFVAVALSLVHSLLGEKLIFRRVCLGESKSPEAPAPLSRRHRDALRTTWHVASVLGFGFAAILFWLALPEATPSRADGIAYVVSFTFLTAAVFWIAGTRGEHPGWIAMLLIAVLVWWR
jgi:hypothetical protein